MGCPDCILGCQLGFQYMDFANDIIPMINADSSGETRLRILGVVGRAIAGETVPNPDQVTESEDFHDILSVVHDGWTLEEYEFAHSVHPSRAGLQSSIVKHPKTKEELEVFWKRAQPGFKWERQYRVSCGRVSNRMPTQVYPEQGIETFRAISQSSQPVINVNEAAMPSNTDVAKRLRQHKTVAAAAVQNQPTVRHGTA